jgi:hypothetical protein
MHVALVLIIPQPQAHDFYGGLRQPYAGASCCSDDDCAPAKEAVIANPDGSYTLRRRLQRRVFRSLDELKAAINRFVAETNDNPKPFVWTTDPKRVLAAVKRGKQALE